MKIRNVSIALMAFVLAGESLDADEVPSRVTGNWIVSETTSPLDYSPLVVAINRPRDGSTDAAQLSIRCRNGRTSITLSGQKLSGNDRAYTVLYSINSSGPFNAGSATQASANDILIQTDVERLLQSLPNEGELGFQLVPRSGLAIKSSFPLEGWPIVKTKLAAACRWLQVSTPPQN